MPYKEEWVDPEILLEHNGVTVYCTYKNDDIENNPAYTNWYTFDKEYRDGEGESFDIRDLPLYSEIVGINQPRFLDSSKDSKAEEEAKSLLWSAWHGDEIDGDGAELLLIKELIRQSLDNGDLVPNVEKTTS